MVDAGSHEAPIHPEVHLHTTTAEPEDSALAVIDALRARGIIS